MTTQGMTVREVRRPDEFDPEASGELMGLLQPAGDGRWVPATIFGAPLGPASDEATAESLVLERGLSSLADRWWVRMRVADEWRPAWLLEVKPDRLRLRWDDPMLMQGGHGEWVRVVDIKIQRYIPRQ